MATVDYIPGTFELNAARMKSCFILMVNGGFTNSIYVNWERYAQSKAILFKNTVGYGHNEAKGMCQAMAYWTPLKAPNIDLILAYAQKHPEANMHIYT